MYPVRLAGAVSLRWVRIFWLYCGRTLSSRLQQGDRHAVFWSSHDHFWGTILASAWREAVWIADLLAQIWIHHLPDMTHMSYYPLFQSPLSCILLSRAQIWQDSLVMQALVWWCMVRFRVIWFGASYAHLKQPHIFKHQIKLVLHSSKYSMCRHTVCVDTVHPFDKK
jgi:hypothetical protein